MDYPLLLVTLLEAEAWKTDGPSAKRRSKTLPSSVLRGRDPSASPSSSKPVASGSPKTGSAQAAVAELGFGCAIALRFVSPASARF